MVMSYLAQYFSSVAGLFVAMAPYMLLGMTIAGVLYVVMRKELVARHIGGHSFASVVKAALFGIPLPLCSCGVLPTSVYLRDSGASKPAVLSFLIATPQTGVDSIAATYGMLGPFFAFFKALSALILGMVGGAIGLITDSKKGTAEGNTPGSGNTADAYTGFRDRMKAMLNYAYVEFVDSIAFRFVIGLLIAGLISLLIPDSYFAESRFASGFPGMLLMIAICTPLYVCSTSSLPIAVALVAKGFSPGAAFVFLIAGPATNAATIAILWKVLGKKTLGVYLGTIMAGAIGMGYLLNLFLLKWQGLTPALFAENLHEMHGGILAGGWVQYVLPAIFLSLLVVSLSRQLINFAALKLPHKASGKIETEELNMGKLTLKISGMNCEHCVSSVKSSINKLQGVDSVSVSLKKRTAEVEGDVSVEAVKSAVEAAGYKVDN